MGKTPASQRINYPRLLVAHASKGNQLHAGECVMSIIYSLGDCADLAESLQYANRRQSSASSIWKWWKQYSSSDESDQSVESTGSKQAEMLCEALVDGANRLGTALSERVRVDERFDRFESEYGQRHSLQTGAAS